MNTDLELNGREMIDECSRKRDRKPTQMDDRVPMRLQKDQKLEIDVDEDRRCRVYIADKSSPLKEDRAEFQLNLK